jgi:pimeloyl-ACP methyl ester carboxylesterase
MSEALWQADGVTLSGREEAPTESPLATVVALHGGGYSAAYWDHPTDRSASLLALGAELGFRVLALDRPGYGASHGLVGDAVRVERQAEIVASLIRSLSEKEPIGAGVFLIGHSQGAILSVRVAARADLADLLLGVDVSGLPLGMPAGLVDAHELRKVDFLPPSTIEFRRQLFYGPDQTFDRAVLDADESMSRPIPASEIIDAANCDEALPEYAERVSAPVQITRAEFEKSSQGGPEWLDYCASLFKGSRRVLTQWQVASGHNISLHRVAKAYHLRAIAFFDEIVQEGKR